MATFASANMTAANGTDLASYTDSGSLHTTFHHPQLGFWSLASIKIQSNEGVLQSANASAYLASGSPATADYDVSLTVNFSSAGSTGQLIGAIGRCTDTSGNFTFYIFRYNRAISLYAIETESATLVTFSGTPTSGNHVLTLKMRGTQLTGLVDGTAVCTVTDSTYTSAGSHGLLTYSSSQTNDWITAYSATDAPVTLTAGSVTATAASNTSVAVTGTACSGGTASFTYQYQRSPDGSTWTNVGSAQSGLGSGVAPSSYTDTGLTTGNTYYYRYKVTDSASGTAYTSAVSVLVLVRTATTYYVANAGSDSNNGTTTGTAWKTVAKVNSFGQVAGDTILFNRGDTFTSANIHVTASGSAGLPITFGAYGTGAQPILQCSNSYGVWCDDAAFVTIQDLNIQGSGVSSSGVTTSTDSCIKVTLAGATDLYGSIIRRNTLSGSVQAVLYQVANAASNGIYGPICCDNMITQCGFAGVVSWQLPAGAHTGTLRIYNPVIQLNTISYMYGLGAGNAQQGFGVYVGNVSGGEISYNKISECGVASDPGAGGGVSGIMSYESNGLAIRLNEVSKIYSPEGRDGCGIDTDLGSRYCIVERNFVFNCDGPAFYDFAAGSGFTQNTGNIFRHNITQNNGRGTANHSRTYGHATFMLVDSAQNTQVYNNTEYSAKATYSETQSFSHLNGLGTGSGLVLRNNNLSVSGSGMTFGTYLSGTTLQSNNYDASGGASFSLTAAGTTYTSLATLQAAGYEMIGTVAVGSTTAPSFANAGGATGVTVGTIAANVSAYDTSTINGSGLDLAANFGTSTPSQDFHGNPLRPSSGNYPVGAVSAPAASSSSTTVYIFGGEG